MVVRVHMEEGMRDGVMCSNICVDLRVCFFFLFLVFFFNDTATTEIYTLSLHDALPILRCFVSASRDQAPEINYIYAN